METREAVTALAALAQETRLAIFRLLVEAGPEGLAAGRIGEALDIAAPTLSFHLKELAHAGLVTSHPQGRFVIYSAGFERMAALVSYLTSNCCRGMPQACFTEVQTALTGCCPPPASRARAKEKKR